MGHYWVCASPGGPPSAGLIPLHPQALLGHLCPWGCPPSTHSSLMTDPFGKPRGGDQRGEPHPGLYSPQGALALHGPAAWRKVLCLAWRKRLGGLLVLPCHLFVSLPASQLPVPPERMTAWPLNQNKLSLNLGNTRQHVQGRNVCVAPGVRGQADTPLPWALPQPLPLAALLSPHILLGLPAPIQTQVLSITLLSSQSPIFH